MAVITNRKELYEVELAKIEQEIESDGMADDLHLSRKQLYQQLIRDEELKFQNYRAENIRRKHNYLPFIVELLRLLAKDKKLMPLYEIAKEKAILNNKKKAATK